MIDNDAAAEQLKRGEEFHKAGKPEEARAVFKQVTEKRPDLAAGWVLLGAMEDEISRREAGMFGGKEAFTRATELRIIPSVISDLANIFLRNERRWEEAEKFYKEAVIRHGMVESAENLAICLMTNAPAKNTPEGWREAWQWYEWRTMNHLRKHHQVWRGESLKAKTILVYLEQGLGDHAWGLRFIKQAKEEGATVLVVATTPSLRLCKAQPYIDRVYDANKDHQVLTDYVAMNMSMPGYMLPGSMPKRDGGYIASGLPMAKPNPDRPRVGLCWAGSTDIGYQAWRNIPLALFGKLVSAFPGIEFVSLQKGPHESDAPEVELNRELITRCVDLWDTARLMESCDLVISGDTVIPHLSAGLGQETWVLSRWIGDWMWGAGGHDPGWYFNTTIFRQPSFGAWEPVLEAVTEHLETWHEDFLSRRGRPGIHRSSGRPDAAYPESARS